MHDPRVGRFFAVDPLIKKYPHYSSYSFSGNKVINSVEYEGLEDVLMIWNEKIHDYERIEITGATANDIKYAWYLKTSRDIKSGDAVFDQGFNLYHKSYNNGDATLFPDKGVLWMDLTKKKHQYTYRDNYAFTYAPEKKSRMKVFNEQLGIAKEELEQSMPDAGELNVQGSVNVGSYLTNRGLPFNRITFGISVNHADDGFGVFANIGGELSSDTSPISFDGININAFWAKYGGEMLLNDFKKWETTISGDIPIPILRGNVGANTMNAQTYIGIGGMYSPGLKKPSLSAAKTYTIQIR